MELLISFLVLLASACIAQILIYRNETNRIKGRGVYDQKGAEAGAQVEAVHQTTIGRDESVSQKPRQKVKTLPLQKQCQAPLPVLPSKLRKRS